jgi:hypothetical protein
LGKRRWSPPVLVTTVPFPLSCGLTTLVSGRFFAAMRAELPMRGLAGFWAFPGRALG